MCKISVIIPVYNVEKYLKKCLDSICNQTLKDIEIICVDDGSSDSSLEILQQYEAKDSRVKVLTQSNQKQGAARNNGISIAKGEYLGFIDSDDWIDLDYYEQLYNSAKTFDCDIAIADYIRIGNGTTKKRLHIKDEVIVTDLDNKFKLCKQAKHPCPTNKIYRSELIKKQRITFPEGVYCEDKIFTCKAVYFANKIVSVPNTYYYYFRRPNSTVKSKNDIITNSKEEANLEVLKFLKSQELKPKSNIFCVTKKVCKKFGLTIYKVKEDLKSEKVLLFGFIPVWIDNSSDARKENRARKKHFKELSKKKIKIETFYSSDYKTNSSIDLYTITFNNPKIVEYQIKLIKKFLSGNYCHIICDNSNIEEAAHSIKSICEKNDVTYYRVNIELPSGYSDSHGRALNWTYKNVIQKRKNDFGFIDHDIFPIKHFNIETYLKNSNLYGYIRTANKIWFLWPAFSFFKYDYVKKYKLNFRKYKFLGIFHYKGADSGSGLWNSIYKKYDINSIPKVDCKYIDIINNSEADWEKAKTGYEPYIQTNLSQYLDDSKWFHSICGGEWRGNVSTKNQIIYKMLDEYLK